MDVFIYNFGIPFSLTLRRTVIASESVMTELIGCKLL